GRGFDNDVVHSELGSVLREYVQMTLSGKARRLPRLRGCAEPDLRDYDLIVRDANAYLSA
ncbi:hypothetical protein RA989_10145, partial [Mycobacteroides abscessus subsp. massiliense]